MDVVVAINPLSCPGHGQRHVHDATWQSRCNATPLSNGNRFGLTYRGVEGDPGRGGLQGTRP
eukprot:5692383-Pyramimonas_sp.AAC.1